MSVGSGLRRRPLTLLCRLDEMGLGLRMELRLQHFHLLTLVL